MRVGVVGSRRRDSSEDKRILVGALRYLLEYTGYSPIECTFVSGGCPLGADRFIVELHKGEALPGSEMVEFLPDKSNINSKWDLVNAMYARNYKIAADSDVLVALVAPDRKGGTENTIKHMTKMGKPILLVLPGGQCQWSNTGKTSESLKSGVERLRNAQVIPLRSSS